MLTLKIFLLACAAVSTATANSPEDKYVTNMSKDSFNHMPDATAYSGTPLKFEYYNAAGADKDLNFMHHIKPVVMRLFDTVVEFEPKIWVGSGKGANAECRNPDDTVKDQSQMHPGCHLHCTNQYRYCDMGSFCAHCMFYRKAYDDGAAMVREDARRQCIWERYGLTRGHDEIYRYFQYMDALNAIGCFKDITMDEACVEQAMQSVDIDFSEIQECAGDVEQDTDKPNVILESILKNEKHVSNVPSLLLGGVEETDFDHLMEVNDKNDGRFHRHPPQVLKMVCDALDDSVPKPPVCDFCLDYCPGKVGDLFDMNTCLWELNCGDKNIGWEHYKQDILNDTKAPQTNTPPITPQGPQPPTTPQSPTTPQPDDSQPPATTESKPQIPAAGASEAAVQEAQSKPQIPAAGTSEAAVQGPKPPAKTSSSSSSSTQGGLSVLATFFAVVLAAGFAALAIMAIRVWRTKMIIDRYVREQQAMNMGGGIDGHRDPTFFPEDTELDLDLEPALQYSDHINTNSGPTTSAPHQANFLPQLT